MLDPLSAIGLASAIVQFVDFGSKLVSQGRELYENGSLAQNDEIQLITESLKGMAADLTKSRMKYAHADDNEIQELARTCQSVADELLTVLKTLHPQKQHSLESFRVALRTARKKGKVDDMGKRLRRLQGQINTYMIMVLSVNVESSLKQHSSTLYHLENIERMARDMKRSNENADTIDRNMASDSDVDIKIEHLRRDLLNAFEKSHKSHKLESVTTTSTTIVQQIIQKCGELVCEGQIVATSNEVLKSLHFKSFKSREAIIKQAYDSTFEWMYDDINTDIGQKIKFLHWLQQGNGIYWVAGKAGSGKSTLMKYIAHDSRTRNNLQIWAGESNIVVASYFFWSGGNQMQKSQIGLLQSLLYQILGQCPELTAEVCPRRWTNIEKTEHGFTNLDPWTLQELSETFERISDLADCSARFCFLIDGLDEYDIRDGEHIDLINTLKALSRSRYIKLCVSSRPWNVFNKAFRDRSIPKLMLQEYTKPDITRYVEGELGKGIRTLGLDQKGIHDSRLTTEIVDRSNGVFLWVFLVVRSLLRGLTDDNDIETLLMRLSSLPVDLEDYFLHMFNSVEDIYRVEAAKILLIALEATRDLPILLFTSLGQITKSPNYSVNLEIQTKPPEDSTSIPFMTDKTGVYLNGRCKDILETYSEAPRNSDSSFRPINLQSFLSTKIGFLHRSARDFLRTADMQKLLQSRVPPDFDPNIALCQLVLIQIKSLPLLAFHSYSDAHGDIEYLMHTMAYHAHQAQRKDPLHTTDLLDEVRVTLLQRAKELETAKSDQGIVKHEDSERLYNGSIQQLLDPTRFVHLIIDNDLYLYFEHLISGRSIAENTSYLEYTFRNRLYGLYNNYDNLINPPGPFIRGRFS
ncbi:Vegetative incompatibility HET-E-1 protein [Rutstroemia sp. NJR-2017a BBW]|nr:Vegetative incompatibility HET-E-1 protein [Rutstroemia sp. NJR-2017a BBW]